jgi:hypothetical protein
MKSGNILSDPYHGSPSTWSGEEVGRVIFLENYLLKPTWTAQDYSSIADTMIASWLKLKHEQQQ